MVVLRRRRFVSGRGGMRRGLVIRAVKDFVPGGRVPVRSRLMIVFAHETVSPCSDPRRTEKSFFMLNEQRGRTYRLFVNLCCRSYDASGFMNRRQHDDKTNLGVDALLT
jgi:hypothetical protein